MTMPNKSAQTTQKTPAREAKGIDPGLMPETKRRRRGLPQVRLKVD
jgi:hypothetical protein